jgi:electron transfer flavoprotein alpha subunit
MYSPRARCLTPIVFLQITVLVAGKNVDAVAKHASSISNVTKVLVLNNDALEHSLAEDMSAVVVQIAKKYTHVLAPATNNGKNFIPRAAAVLNCSPLTDVLAVVDESTFKRPMYAGNAIATMKMTNDVKVRAFYC